MDELYQSQILSLARQVRQSKDIAHPTHLGRVKNPVCGDEIAVTIRMNETIIDALHIDVEGCALCEAGAGLLYAQAKGADTAAVARLSRALSAYLVGDDNGHYEAVLAPFTPIRDVKNRHKCVTLAFKAFEKAYQP